MPSVLLIKDTCGHRAGETIEVSERAFANLLERGKAEAVSRGTVATEEPEVVEGPMEPVAVDTDGEVKPVEDIETEPEEELPSNTIADYELADYVIEKLSDHGVVTWDDFDEYVKEYGTITKIKGIGPEREEDLLAVRPKDEA